MDYNDYKEIKKDKMSVLDYIEQNSVNEEELLRQTAKKIMALEKQKKEIDAEIKAEKKKLQDCGVNIQQFNRVLTTIKAELKMSIDSLMDNVSIYNALISDPELINTISEEVKSKNKAEVEVISNASLSKENIQKILESEGLDYFGANDDNNDDEECEEEYEETEPEIRNIGGKPYKWDCDPEEPTPAQRAIEAYFPDCLTTEEKKQLNSYTYTLIDNPDFLTHSTMMNKSKGLTKGVLDYLKDNDEFLYNEAVNTYRQNLDRELQKEIGIKI